MYNSNNDQNKTKKSADQSFNTGYQSFNSGSQPFNPGYQTFNNGYQSYYPYNQGNAGYPNNIYQNARPYSSFSGFSSQWPPQHQAPFYQQQYPQQGYYHPFYVNQFHPQQFQQPQYHSQWYQPQPNPAYATYPPAGSQYTSFREGRYQPNPNVTLPQSYASFTLPRSFRGLRDPEKVKYYVSPTPKGGVEVTIITPPSAPVAPYSSMNLDVYRSYTSLGQTDINQLLLPVISGTQPLQGSQALVAPSYSSSLMATKEPQISEEEKLAIEKTKEEGFKIVGVVVKPKTYHFVPDADGAFRFVSNEATNRSFLLSHDDGRKVIITPDVAKPTGLLTGANNLNQTLAVTQNSPGVSMQEQVLTFVDGSSKRTLTINPTNDAGKDLISQIMAQSSTIAVLPRALKPKQDDEDSYKDNESELGDDFTFGHTPVIEDLDKIAEQQERELQQQKQQQLEKELQEQKERELQLQQLRQQQEKELQEQQERELQLQQQQEKELQEQQERELQLQQQQEKELQEQQERELQLRQQQQQEKEQQEHERNNLLGGQSGNLLKKQQTKPSFAQPIPVPTPVYTAPVQTNKDLDLIISMRNRLILRRAELQHSIEEHEGFFSFGLAGKRAKIAGLDVILNGINSNDTSALAALDVIKTARSQHPALNKTSGGNTTATLLDNLEAEAKAQQLVEFVKRNITARKNELQLQASTTASRGPLTLFNATKSSKNNKEISGLTNLEASLMENTSAEQIEVKINDAVSAEPALQQGFFRHKTKNLLVEMQQEVRRAATVKIKK